MFENYYSNRSKSSLALVGHMFSRKTYLHSLAKLKVKSLSEIELDFNKLYFSLIFLTWEIVIILLTRCLGVITAL